MNALPYEALQSKLTEIQTISNGNSDLSQIQEYASVIKDLDSAQAELLLSTQGLSKEKIQQSLAIKSINEASEKQNLLDSNNIKNKQSSTPVMSKWVASLKAATMLIWEQVTATAAWLSTTPAGWATLAVAAITAVIGGIHAYNKSIDDSVDNAKNKLVETEALLSSLSTEKETIAQKIKELPALS